MVALSGQRFDLTAGDSAVSVAEVGAGLRRFTHQGADVTCTYGDDDLTPKGCGITLVPWPNRIRGGRYRFDGTDYQLALTEPALGNAIHGLGRWARWAPVEHTTDTLTLALDVVPQNGYPFPVHAEVTYHLDADRGLTVTVAAHNRGSARAPFGAGAHPYLSTRGHEFADVTLRLPARERLEVDDAQIPTGSTPVAGTPYDFRAGRVLGDLRMDDGFTALDVADGRGSAYVGTPSGGATLWFDASIGYLQVFTRADLTPGQHGVAVEPMTCAPDAFNSGAGLLVLDPDERWSTSWGITPD